MISNEQQIFDVLYTVEKTFPFRKLSSTLTTYLCAFPTFTHLRKYQAFSFYKIAPFN